MISNENNCRPLDRGPVVKRLLTAVRRMGASDAAMLSAGDIHVEDHLADMCRKPRCENYGLSASCPPHVAGPDAFRALLKEFQQAIFFKLDVSYEILYSSDRREYFQLLHEIAAGLEGAAIKEGFERARGYAGGSCKQLFCHDYPECRVMAGKGACRNQGQARPSMSGYGVNVGRLVEAAGWSSARIKPDAGSAVNRPENIYGLVLVC